jgi:hypothetical protein
MGDCEPGPAKPTTETVANTYFPLPDFPTAPLHSTPDSLKDSYLWAKAILAWYGEAAPTFVQSAMIKAVEAQDWARFNGWQNISFVLAEFARPAGPDDTIQ